LFNRLTMLAALKRRKKQTVKLTVLQKIQANANRRKNERESSNSTSLRTQRMKKDSKLLTTYRRTALHKQQQHRKKQLAQKELEAKDFKRWVKHRNPNLNRTIDQKNQRNQTLREWFDFLDDDGSGEITRDELGLPLISLGLAPSMAEVDALINTVDQDGSGEIDFYEFTDMLTKNPNGPIQTLLNTIASGELGDPTVTSVRSLLTAARRRVICNTLHSYGRNERSAQDNKMLRKDRRTVQELQKMQNDKYAATVAAKAAAEATALARAKKIDREKKRGLKKQKKKSKQVKSNKKKSSSTTPTSDTPVIHPVPAGIVKPSPVTHTRPTFDTVVNAQNVGSFRAELDERMRKEVYGIVLAKKMRLPSLPGLD
jgi:hypothetical protein